jgi:hypothetical protein
MTTAFREAWITPPTPPATDEDRAAVEEVVRDYYEGWYTADAERMTRALHPDLAKRAHAMGPDRASRIDHTTMQEMVEATAAGMGRARAGNRLEIRIAELGGGIASVNVFADHYVDFLHMIETPDGWKIINALWRWADGHGPRA